MNKRIVVFAVFCIIMFVQISCKTKQVVFNEILYTPNTQEIVGLMEKNQFRYNTLSLKFKAEAQYGDENNSFSGNIYIVNDSMIWVSIQKLGIEAFRLLFSSDSVKMLNRIDKTYLSGDFNTLNKMLNARFDFNILQALLTGNDVKNYETAGFVGKYDKDGVVLSYENRKKQTGGSSLDLLNQELWFKTEEYKISRNIIKEVSENSSRTIEFKYSEFQDFGGQKFPQKIEFEISDIKKITGDIIFTRISPDKTETFPFTVPANYTLKN